MRYFYRLNAWLSDGSEVAIETKWLDYEDTRMAMVFDLDAVKTRIRAAEWIWSWDHAVVVRSDAITALTMDCKGMGEASA